MELKDINNENKFIFLLTRKNIKKTIDDIMSIEFTSENTSLLAKKLKMYSKYCKKLNEIERSAELG